MDQIHIVGAELRQLGKILPERISWSVPESMRGLMSGVDHSMLGMRGESWATTSRWQRWFLLWPGNSEWEMHSNGGFWRPHISAPWETKRWREGDEERVTLVTTSTNQAEFFLPRVSPVSLLLSPGKPDSLVNWKGEQSERSWRSSAPCCVSPYLCQPQMQKGREEGLTYMRE